MKKHILFVTFSLIFLAGCRSSKSPTPTYYILECPKDIEYAISDSLIPIPVKIEVEKVGINPPFALNQIAIREESNKIRYFSQHSWAARPEQSLTRFIISFYDKNNYFHNVNTRFWKLTPDYHLKTTVHVLEVIKEKKDFHAHLYVEFILLDVETEQVLIKHVADKTNLLESRNLNLFANSISKMFYDELLVFSEEVVKQLSTK